MWYICAEYVVFSYMEGPCLMDMGEKPQTHLSKKKTYDISDWILALDILR